jgi:hypothetical protein
MTTDTQKPRPIVARVILHVRVGPGLSTRAVVRIRGDAIMMPMKECRRRTTRRPGEAVAGPDAFERLVRIMKDSERLLLELQGVDARLGEARSYLAAPGSSLPLALGTLAHLKTKRSGLLTLLRSCRIAAEEVLGPLEPVEAVPMS